MNRFVRWLDGYIYVDRLRLRGSILPHMRAGQWVVWTLVLVAAGPVFVVLNGLAEHWTADWPAQTLAGFVRFLVAASLLGAAYAVLLPEPEGGSTSGLRVLSILVFTASAMVWTIYGPAIP